MSTARHTERVPGLHLRVARMQRGLAQRDVARQLGVSPRRISSLEGAAFVPCNTADRYFDALEHLVQAVRRAALDLSRRSEEGAEPVAKPDRSWPASGTARRPAALDGAR